MAIFRRRRADHQACRSLCLELDSIIETSESQILPGVSTAELDTFVANLTLQHGLKPLFKGNPLNPYPAHITASINEQVVNTLPSNRRLRDGDLLSLQFGVERDGAFACQAWTFPVGAISDRDARLYQAGLSALRAAIGKVATGERVWAVTCAIQETLEHYGYTPGRDFMGHAIGRQLHEEPGIPCFKSPLDKAHSPKLTERQLLSINVFAHEGSYRTRVEKDGWSVVAADGKKVVHFSQMVAVREGGRELLNRWLLERFAG